MSVSEEGFSEENGGNPVSSGNENGSNHNSAAQRPIDLSTVGLIFESHDTEFLKSLEDLKEALYNVKVNQDYGLTMEQVVESRSKYGSNSLPPPVMKLRYETFKDIIKTKRNTVLIALALFHHVLSFLNVTIPKYGLELTQLVVLLLLLLIIIILETDIAVKIENYNNSVSEYEIEDCAYVLRSGTVSAIPPVELVVGDILIIKAGNYVLADGICLESNNLVCEESHGKASRKSVPKGDIGSGADHLILSGSLVTSGVAKVLCLGIGSNSLNGKRKLMLRSSKRFDLTLASVYSGIKSIYKFQAKIKKTFFFIFFLIYIYLLRDVIHTTNSHITKTIFNLLYLFSSYLFDILILYKLFSATITSSFISLCLFNTASRMLKSGIIVKNLQKIETAGRSKIVLTHNIGILTLNYMIVTYASIANSELNMNFVMPLCLSKSNNGVSNVDLKKLFSGSINNDSIIRFCQAIFFCCSPNDDKQSNNKFVTPNSVPEVSSSMGSPLPQPSSYISPRILNSVQDLPNTDSYSESLTLAALLEFIKWLGPDFDSFTKKFNILKQLPYDKVRKYSAALTISDENEVFIFVVGSAEAIIPKITSYIDRDSPNDSQTDLKDVKPEYYKNINTQLLRNTRRALKTEIIAYKMFHIDSVDLGSACSPDYITYLVDSGLIHIGTIGIHNPPLEGIYDAVKAMNRANVKLILLTEDGPGVSNSILWKYCDVDVAGEISMDGKRLIFTSPEELDVLIEHVKVIYNCGPNEAKVLVEKLKYTGFIVSYTHTGYNGPDEATTRVSDVIYSIGNATPTAKYTSDIILQKNSLIYVVKSIMHGRSFIFNAARLAWYKYAANIGIFVNIVVTRIFLDDKYRNMPSKFLLLLLLSNYYNPYVISSSSASKNILNVALEPGFTNHTRMILLAELFYTLFEWFLATVFFFYVNGYNLETTYYSGTLHSSMLSFTMLMVTYGGLHWLYTPLCDTAMLNISVALKNKKCLLYAILITLFQYLLFTSKILSGLFDLHPLKPYEWALTLLFTAFLALLKVIVNHTIHAIANAWKEHKNSSSDYESLSSGSNLNNNFELEALLLKSHDI